MTRYVTRSTDRDGMVADALVEPGQHGELDGGAEVDAVGRVEDRGDELVVEVVEDVVHVRDRGGPSGVVEQVGLGCLPEEPGRLRSHAADQAAKLWWEGVAVHASCRLGHVDGQVARTLDFGEDAQRGNDPAQVGRHWGLEGEEAVAALLDGQPGRVELVVGDEHSLRLVDVLGQDDVGGADDLLRDGRRQPRDRLTDVTDVTVKHMSQ